MLESTQQSLVKIDAFISGIRMINLHVFNYLCDHSTSRRDNTDANKIKAKQLMAAQLKKMNAAHMQEHLKFISEYIKKCLKDMSKVKLILPPLVFRPLRQKLLDQDFLRFENTTYGVKFVFTDLYKECLLNLQIYRKVIGGRHSGLATKKLEITFLHDLSVRYPDGMFTSDTLEIEGKSILDEITAILSGQKCAMCFKHLCFNNQILCFLPPTIRQIVELKENKKDKKYYHQSCI